MPEAEDGRVGFVTIDDNLELQFEEAVYRRDVRTHSDTIPISSDPEPYHLISPPHLDLTIPFPVSPLRICLSRLASLQPGPCSTFPLSSTSDPLS